MTLRARHLARMRRRRPRVVRSGIPSFSEWILSADAIYRASPIPDFTASPPLRWLIQKRAMNR